MVRLCRMNAYARGLLVKFFFGMVCLKVLEWNVNLQFSYGLSFAHVYYLNIWKHSWFSNQIENMVCMNSSMILYLGLLI